MTITARSIHQVELGGLRLPCRLIRLRPYLTPGFRSTRFHLLLAEKRVVLADLSG